MLSFFIGLTAAFSQRLPALIPYRKGQLWGFADSTGKIKIPCKYTRADIFINGFARVNSNGKAGFINTKGDVVVPFKYDTVICTFKPIGGRVFIRSNNSRDFEAYSSSGKAIELDYFPVTDNFSEGFIPVEYESGSFGFMDAKWMPAFNKQSFEMIRQGFSEGLAPVMKNSRWGYVAIDGRMAIEPKYTESFSFEGQKALVILRKDEEKVGYYPQSTEYGSTDSVPLYKEYYAFGIIDRRGAQLALLERSDAYFSTVAALTSKLNFDKKKKEGNFKDMGEPYFYPDGSATVQNAKGMRGLLDKEGKLVLPCIYSDILNISEGLVTAWKGYYATPAARCQVFSMPDGKAVISNYHSVWMFNNGFAVADSMAPNSKYFNGIVDKTGKLRVPLKYPNLQNTPAWGLFVILQVEVTHTPAMGYIDIYGREYFAD